MPSKSKKNSKTASSPSVISTPSPYRTPNPDTELNESDFFGVLDEASRKFPSLISKSAFIGKVSNDTSAVNSFLDVLDSKGCKIWLSESAMLSSSIPPGSIVSVSIASRNFSSSKPLSSLAEACAISFGFDCLENMGEAAGSYFALATVFPSSKLMKHAVCLSPNLLFTMGCPASGRIVFVYPVCNQPVIGTLNGYDKLEEAICSSVSLNNCKELHLSLVSSKGKFTMNSTMSSDLGLLGDIKNIQDENGNIASPQTPSSSQAKLNSSHTSLLHTPKFQESRLDLSHVEEKSTDTINISEMLVDDNVRKLLQSCSASWLFSRYLMLGNFMVVPLLSRLCIFMAIGATGDFQNQTDKSNNNLISCSPDLIRCVNDAFLINHETKVYLHSSRDSVTQDPTGKASLSRAPVHGDSRIKKGITFPKLGALAKEFAVLKDIIVASAVKDDLASMGLRPTKGVLLHGPPGTGKTSLAKLCAHEAGVNLFLVHGPEIVSQYYGESERALHEVFDSARKALPSVVFIDELDAIAPARKHGGEELSQRMVATLLTLMDGINKIDGLVVIAATNRPDTIEPALRRPGRFDREIEIGVPSPKQRLEILLSLLSEVEHTLLEEDVHHLAGVTHGFVGADLASLCNEAALVCLRRYIRMTTNGSDHNLANIAHESCNGVANSNFGAKCREDCSMNDLDDISSSISKLSFSSSNSGYGLEVSEACAVGDHLLKVTVEDFEKARIKVRPSAMREVILEVPKVRWEDIGGQREVKMQLMEAVEWPQKHRDAFKRIGTQPPTGVLMFGPPGCSKTLLARAVASEAGLNFLAVKGPELFSKWVGESEKAVKSLFAKARANAPSIIFFDEIDGLAVIRGKESDGVSVSDRVMSQLLVELDGLHQRVDVTVIAATNRPDNIDPALLRPGRFDRLLYVGPPDRKDREDVFRVHLCKRPCSSDVCIKDLALLTEGYTGADISRVCNEASIRAIEENFNASEITMEHLKAGIELVKPSEVRSYEGLSNKFQRLVHSSAENVYECQVSSTQQCRLSFWNLFRSVLGFHR